MISKIIILVVATGIGLASYIPKGIDEAMNNHQRISEHQEYKKHTDTVKIEEKIEDMAEADRTNDLAYLEQIEGDITNLTPAEIAQYLDKNDIPYECGDINMYPYHQYEIQITKGAYIIRVQWFDDQFESRNLDIGIQSTDDYVPPILESLQLNINN